MTEPASPDKSDTVEKSQDDKKVTAPNRDKRDMLDIILKFISALGTATVVALIGIFGSNFLAERQKTDTNLRLYVELMTRREEADASLRKEMFSLLITDSLQPALEEHPEKKLLKLELLAYNFHDSVDFGPLFKDLYKKLDYDRPRSQPYIDRLQNVTRDVVAKQVAMLEEAGGKLDGLILFDELKGKPGGLVVMDQPISLRLNNPQGQVISTIQKQVRIEVLSVKLEKQEVVVRLMVRNSQNKDEADALLTVGFFDFPMLDNIGLPEGGYRCSVVLNHFDESAAGFTFVYFPSSRASLKERSNYDEFLKNLRAE